MIGIQLTEDYDLDVKVERDAQGRIASGMVLAETTAQNQALILQCHKGEIKESPAVGVGIEDMLLDHDPLRWRTRIREQLEIDGQKVDEVKVTNQGISIKASYQ